MWIFTVKLRNLQKNPAYRKKIANPAFFLFLSRLAMNEKRKILSSKLRLARLTRGYSQEQLAQKMLLSNSAVSRAERGQTAIDTDRLADFAIALNIDEAFFYRNDIDVNTIFRVD